MGKRHRRKIRVLHQVLNPQGIGGVSSEFKALAHSSLGDSFVFQEMVLKDFRPGLNLHDLMFYYRSIQVAQPDIIHIRGAAIDGLNAVIAAKLANKGRILVTVHGMYSDLIYIHPIKKWISKNIIERTIYTLSDGISCVCKNADDRVYFKKYRKKMLPYVYNRMPVYDLSKHKEYYQEIRKKYTIPENAIVALYVGRITKEKGLEVLANALLSLRSIWPEELVIMIVGRGEYLTRLEERCACLNKCIVYMGEQQNVEPFYAAADFFIHPSLHENHSISLLEAVAAKLPCIATNCGGNSEIIQNDIGMLIPAYDEVALANAIRKMCNKEVRYYYEEAMRTHDFSQFSDAAVDKSLAKVYTRLMEM